MQRNEMTSVSLPGIFIGKAKSVTVGPVYISPSAKAHFYFKKGTQLEKVFGIDGKEITEPLVGKHGNCFFEEGVIFKSLASQNNNAPGYNP